MSDHNHLTQEQTPHHDLEPPQSRKQRKWWSLAAYLSIFGLVVGVVYGKEYSVPDYVKYEEAPRLSEEFQGSITDEEKASFVRFELNRQVYLGDENISNLKTELYESYDIRSPVAAKAYRSVREMQNNHGDWDYVVARRYMDVAEQIRSYVIRNDGGNISVMIPSGVKTQPYDPKILEIMLADFRNALQTKESWEAQKK
ncbi:hypothetical protein ACYPKM_05105 [Pseudomonas aeruginosa]